jgi:hypothetical protein
VKKSYLPVPAINWVSRLGCDTSLPSWSCGFDSRFTSTEVVYGVTGTDVTELPEYGVSP